PGSGDPIVNMKLDIVLGCYWVTKEVPGEEGEGRYFASPNGAIMAYDFDQISLRAKVKMVGGKKEKYGEMSGQIFETTVGRVMFNNNLPSDFPFINKEINAKEIT